MERPRSIMGPPTTVPTHKRNTSSVKSLSKVQGPATAERPQSVSHRPAPSANLSSRDRETLHLYITNLKLLHFKALADWPNITTNSFSQNDSKTRLRCSEWSLYQLFRVYDHHMTLDKLQPFFPPLEPLQSINLRAALYRCLNELKKNGVLGREVVLRKTMLDECSGEKFWDMCLVFSAVVLRKVTLKSVQQQQQQHFTPIAQRLGSAQHLPKKERESLLPLAIAHKSALSRVLSDKQRRRQSYIHIFDSMKDKEDELVRRKHAIDTQQPIVESAEHAKELRMVEKEINGKWTDDESFKDAIINGDPAKSGDHMLLQSTDEFLARLGREDDVDKDTRRDSGVLEDVQLQARAQIARVKEWQAFYARLQIDRRTSTASRESKDQQKPVDLQFDQHHDLGIDDIQQPQEQQQQLVKSATQPEPIPSYVSKYDEILTTMREELRRNQTARREVKSCRSASTPVRQPSITLDAVAGAPQLSHSTRAAHRSISPTFPLRPEMARRASSRSRSYQQPKVISQREHIPLKSEIFSPLKRNGSVSPASARSSLIGSPIDEAGSATMSFHLTDHRAKRESQSSIIAPTVDSAIGLGLDLVERPAEDVVFKKPAQPASRSVSFAHRKSLSERTRLSMSFTNTDDNPTMEQDTNISPQRPSEASQALAMRTRQSMSGISVPLPIRTNSLPLHNRANSIAAPILQPKQRPVVRQASQSLSHGSANLNPAAVNTGQAKRNITPRERLFEADAAYKSVFKSRPKIATSPPLTPAADDDNDILIVTRNLDGQTV